MILDMDSPQLEQIDTMKRTERFLKTLGILSASIICAVLIGVFSFLWSINNDMTSAKVREEARNERVKQIDDNVKTIKDDVKEIKENDIQILKDRMTRIEEQNKARLK